MAEVKGVVFDIDDTLYLERDYVRSGFRAIAAFLGKRGSFPEHEIFTFLWRAFESGVRGKTFDQLFQTFPDMGESFSISDLVSVYREHIPSIQMQDGMLDIIERLKAGDMMLGAVSDGPLVSQNAKAVALGLDRFFNEIVLTDVWGKEFWKPHPRAFDFLEQRFELLPRELVYIGDNPKKDFVAPKMKGWMTIRLRMPGQLRFDEQYDSAKAQADHVVGSLRELCEFLE